MYLLFSFILFLVALVLPLFVLLIFFTPLRAVMNFHIGRYDAFVMIPLLSGAGIEQSVVLIAERYYIRFNPHSAVCPAQYVTTRI